MFSIISRCCLSEEAKNEGPRSWLGSPDLHTAGPLTWTPWRGTSGWHCLGLCMSLELILKAQDQAGEHQLPVSL